MRAKLRRVVPVDGRSPASERGQPPELAAPPDVSQHVRAVDDQGDLGPRSIVPRVEACMAVRAGLDADAVEGDARRRCPRCSGRRRERQGQRLRLEHGGGGAVADPDPGRRRVGTDGLQGGGAFGGEGGGALPAGTDVLRREHDERRRRAAGLSGLGDGRVRHEYAKGGPDDRDPEAMRYGRRPALVLHLGWSHWCGRGRRAGTRAESAMRLMRSMPMR